MSILTLTEFLASLHSLYIYHGDRLAFKSAASDLRGRRQPHCPHAHGRHIRRYVPLGKTLVWAIPDELLNSLRQAYC